MNDTFPYVPALHDAIPIADDPEWRYPSSAAAGRGIGRLRVWRTPAGTPVAVVTDLDRGASITTSAERIHRALTDRFGPDTVVIEHWPATGGADGGEHFDQVAVTGRSPRWRRLHADPTAGALAQDPDDARNRPVKAAVFQWRHAGLECVIAAGFACLTGYVLLPPHLRGLFADESDAQQALDGPFEISYIDERGWVGIMIETPAGYWSPDDLINRVSDSEFRIAQEARTRYEQVIRGFPGQVAKPRRLTVARLRAEVEDLATHIARRSGPTETGTAE